MEKETPELLQLLEKVAAEVGATNPIAADTKKESIFSQKFKALSLSKPKQEVADYTADNRASYLMLKGSMLKALNKNEEAIACFREVIQLDNWLKEKYYVPYTLFELAECYYHNDHIKEAQETLKKCNNLSGYAWEDPLKVRLRVTMDQLKNGGIMEDDGEPPSTLIAISASNGSEPPASSGPKEDSTTLDGAEEKIASPAMLSAPIQASS